MSSGILSCNRQLLAVVLAILSLVSPTAAQLYHPPPDNRTNVLLNPGWRFIRQDVAGAELPGFDDSSWTPLDLPHTWNNLDGQDGGNNYYRGIGWYRRHYTVNTNAVGQRLFLKFDGANIVTDVYVNGAFLGEHRGGFAAFTFDITTNVTFGADTLIAVKVSNAGVPDVAPQSGDFTFFGGLYRDVHLLATDPLHISPLDFGSPGVYLETTNVSAVSANLQITTVVSNANITPRTANVRAIIVDAATNFVQTLTNLVVLPAGSVSNIAATTLVSNPHLWDGLNDPYLYQVFVEVSDGTNVTDWLNQPLGIRSWTFDPTNGVTLNGHAYDLHGVNMHQDWLNRGWAIGDAERETNFTVLKELGATMVRLSHYEHNDYTYQLADKNGVVLWTEIPLINGVGTGNFNANAEQQMVELIRQRRNHPSIVSWGVFNEETSAANTVVSNLVVVVHREDPTRPATAASNQSTNTAINWMPDITAFNQYSGWYGGTTADFPVFLDTLHATYPTRVVGISEYGAGAAVTQHSEEPLVPPPPFGSPHPMEWQNKFHEDYWLAIKQRPFLWCKQVWNLFDFAVDSRNEGDTPGRNDKGLVTYDRQLRKDAFYFYKANWTTNPMVYITGHTFTNRLTNSFTAKVYANCSTVELFLNGVSQGTRSNLNDIFTWPVTLLTGSNFVQAIGIAGPAQVNDSLFWFAPLSVSITSPTASIVFLNSTNDTLQLTASPSGSPGPIQSWWSMTSGPGTVSFGNSNALTTTGKFSAEGFYGLSITVSNGATASAALTVVVNPNSPITNGLQAWWKMDETNGATAADSSGNGRTATIVGGTFTGGYLSNALQFNGTTGRASYSAQNSNQVTVTAWVRADAQGNSQFPRIVDTPTFRVFFRFGSSDVNSVGFATLDSTNGDFDSGGGTIGLGSWYHVAASYDRSNLTNLPLFYVNGIRRSTVTLTMPSGTPPPLSGTGYIGNRAALDRAWSGPIDDLRIYNRLLSDIEVQAIAAAPTANVAPIVFAGTNQSVFLPASASLSGSVADDGEPDPPGAVTATWTQLSGPGAAVFANSNAATTTVSFPIPGTYALQLVGDDGQVKTIGYVTITVFARPTITIRSLPGGVELSWPTNGGPWRLQTQTNALNRGVSANWVDVPGSTATNLLVVPVGSTNGSVFYRLILP